MFDCMYVCRYTYTYISTSGPKSNAYQYHPQCHVLSARCFPNFQFAFELEKML